MLVRMLINIGGYRDGEPWPRVGGTIDLPDHEAGDMISNGYAEAAAGDEEATDAIPAAGDDDPAPAEDGDADPAGDDDPAPAEDEQPVTTGRRRKA